MTQEINISHRVWVLHVGQQSWRLSATVPNHVDLGIGLDAMIQCDPETAHLPPQDSQHPVAAATMMPSPDKSDAGPKAAQNKVRKCKKLLRQIDRIEEKQQSGISLHPEEISKLQRKDDVLTSLAEAEEEWRSYND